MIINDYVVLLFWSKLGKTTKIATREKQKWIIVFVFVVKTKCFVNDVGLCFDWLACEHKSKLVTIKNNPRSDD